MAYRDEDRVVVSEVTSRRPSSAGEGPLMKEAHEALESHGPRWAFTAFELDLDGYVEQFNEQVIGAYAGGKGGALRLWFGSEAELNRLFELLLRAGKGKSR